MGIFIVKMFFEKCAWFEINSLGFNLQMPLWQQVQT